MKEINFKAFEIETNGGLLVILAIGALMLLGACKGVENNTYSSSPAVPAPTPTTPPPAASEPPPSHSQERSILDMSLDVDGKQALCHHSYAYLYLDPQNSNTNRPADKICMVSLDWNGVMNTMCIPLANMMAAWGSLIGGPGAWSINTTFSYSNPQGQPENCSVQFNGFWQMTSVLL